MVPRHRGIKRGQRRAVARDRTPSGPLWLDPAEMSRLGVSVEVCQTLPADDPASARRWVSAAMTIAAGALTVASRVAGHYGIPTRQIIQARYETCYALMQARADGLSPEAG
jgi:hypothetical protein